MKISGIEVGQISIENYLVLATGRNNHYKVVQRKDNKKDFWAQIFNLREKGNLSSKSLKGFFVVFETF